MNLAKLILSIYQVYLFTGIKFIDLVRSRKMSVHLSNLALIVLGSGLRKFDENSAILGVQMKLREGT